MSAVLWALIAVPLGTGTLLCAGGRRAGRYAPPLAVAGAAAAVVMAAVVAYGHPSASAPLLENAPFRLTVDGVSGLMAVTVAAVTLAVLLFSVAGIGASARFFGLMLLFSGAMLVTVTAATLPALLMGWEVMGATSWALIGYWWREPERVAAAGVAFLTTRAADLGLYLAAGAALAVAGGRGMALDTAARTPSPWVHLLTAGVVVAALGKSAQLPFSFWLSRAMQGPSPVSALLHSATMVVAGAYLLLRLRPLLTASGWGDDLVAWTGAATALALGLVAVAQTDLKQLLAASSCAQIGFMVLAAGAGAATGGTLQLIAHAAAKSLAFLVAGLWLTWLGSQRLSGLRGAARRGPVAGVAFTVAALSLAGVPPLSLWAAKDVLLAGALERGSGLYAVGLAAATVSAVYSGKALWFVWRRAGLPSGRSAEHPSAHREERPSAHHAEHASAHPTDKAAPAPASPAIALPFIALPLVALAAFTAALGVLVLPPLRAAVARTLGVHGEAAPHGWEFVLSAALALAGGGAAWAWGERRAPVPVRLGGWLGDWLRLEAAARTLLVRPVQRLAGALAAFDDRVLDRGTEALARAAVRLAGVVDSRLESAVDGAVEGTAAASRALGRLARRPQTGQLHQYLAQAVTGFAVLAAVFVLVLMR